MNWTNYRRLRAFLESLPDEAFNYGIDLQGREGAACGCVAHYARQLFRTVEMGPLAISEALGVPVGESCYLYGAAATTHEAVEPDAPQFFAYNPDAIGRPGRLEALRRLAVVAARYGGEPASTPEPKPFVADDAAFLASVRALIGQPLVEAE